MNAIPVGTRLEHRMLVTGDVAIDFLGAEEARVFGTPWLIAYMEMTARNAIKPLLEEGWDSVGTTVNIRHLGATPLGLPVRIAAEVTAVDGQRVTFKVDAWDEREKIGEGVHERFVIHVPRFIARLARKRSEA
jgi:predicted thioesterase